MMSRSDQSRQNKPGLGSTVKSNQSTAENGDPTYETTAKDVSEMNEGPAEKVRTGREQKAKPEINVSGACMRGGNQEQYRGSVMCGK